MRKIHSEKHAQAKGAVAIDFRQLEYLVELDKTRNFTYAADHLYLTHGALVHFVTKLEQEAGAALFLRGKNGLIPTKIGELYIRMARDMLRVYRRYQEAICEELGHSSGSFTVVGLPQFAEAEFPLVYRNFKCHFPETTVTFSFSIDDTVSCEQVSSGAADIAVSFSSCKTQQSVFKNTLVFEKYATESPLLVLPPDMPLPLEVTDVLKPVRLSFFQEYNLFCPQYKEIPQLFQQHHFAPKQISYTTTAVTAFHYVKNGDGVGIIAPSGIPDRHAVRCLRLEPTLSFDYYLISRTGDTLTKAQKLFCRLCKEEFQRKNGWADGDADIFHSLPGEQDS